MKTLVALALAVLTVAIAATSAAATPGADLVWVTYDYPANTPSYHFITDTLGGNGRPRPARGYRFVTDTLGGNGGARTAAPAVSGGEAFDWGAALVGAGSAVGTLLALMGAALLALRRRLAV
jgi:hypothetical protein